jgi:hypothetical protein
MSVHSPFPLYYLSINSYWFILMSSNLFLFRRWKYKADMYTLCERLPGILMLEAARL